MSPAKPNPTPVNVLKWAGWGALVGLALRAFTADYGDRADSIYVRDYALIAAFVGSVVGGAFVGALAGFVRNLFIRRT